ncbi:MFS transporter [Flindersiella endophytica]
MPAESRTASTAREVRRVAFAGAIGTAVEWYDFFIYGTAATLVLGRLFFPSASPLAETLSAFATFSVGFLARPLGGVVIGHFGDRLGRKTMLVWTLLLMGVATTGIGLLPTYAQVGVLAPILLVILRFAQGFALGGEWSGAVLLSVEHAPPGRRGWFGSLVALGLPAGIILSNTVFLVVSATTSDAAFASWGWRVPFLGSALLVAFGLFVRLRVAESPIFVEARRTQSTRRLPIAEVLRRDSRTMLLAAGSYLGLSGLGYLVIVYFVSYATGVLRLPRTSVLLLVIVASVAQTVSIVVFARWSDRLGRRRVWLWGLVALALWSVVFFPLADTRSWPLLTLSLVVMMALHGTYLGPQPAVFSELFDTTVRYSGSSASVQLGTILGGGLVPFVATALYAAAGSSWPLTAYTIGLSVVSLLCVLGLRETYQRDLTGSLPRTPVKP